MYKVNKCDADVCFGGSGSRCPRITCDYCTNSCNIKCANVNSAGHKLLRNTPGACWMCLHCRDPASRKPNSNEAIDLILQHTTSYLKLIGTLVDHSQQLWRSYTALATKLCYVTPPCTSSTTTATSVNTDREVFQNVQLMNISDFFESIIGDKRPRTSSPSRPSQTHPEKGVDVPVSTAPSSRTTVSSFPDAIDGIDFSAIHTTTNTPVSVPLAVFATAVGHIITAASSSTCTSAPSTAASPTAAPPTTTTITATSQTSAPTITVPLDTAPLIGTLSTTTQPATIPPSPSTVPIVAALPTTAPPTSAALTVVPPTAAVSTAALARIESRPHSVPSTAAPLTTAPPTSILSNATVPIVTSIALPATTNQTTEMEVDTPHASTTDTEFNPPVLAVIPNDDDYASINNLAINVAQRNWFYITKFQPSESTNNLISYIQCKTKCDRSLIMCSKLIPQNRNSTRPNNCCMRTEPMPVEYRSLGQCVGV